MTRLQQSPSRPVLQLPWSAWEQALEIAAAAGLLLHVLVVLRYWSDLPQVIPRHFGAAGMPDAWGGKTQLWLLPALSAVLYAGLSLLSRHPHRFNYPWPITPENAAAQYRLARTLIVVLKTEIMWLFFYITWVTIRVAQGGTQGLGVAFLPAMLVVIFGSMGVYFYRAARARAG